MIHKTSAAQQEHNPGNDGWCHLARVTVFVSIGCALPFIIVATQWTPLGLTYAESFSRSGSLITILALLSSAMLSEFRVKYAGEGFADLSRQVIFYRYERWYEVLKFVAYSLSFLGAIIWGYGDVVVVGAT